MSIDVTSNIGSDKAINIMQLIEEASQITDDQQKDLKITRKLHHQKNMGLLDQNIDSLKDQQKQLGKAGVFNFVLGMVSNFFNLATTIVGTLFPPAAPIANAVNTFLQGVIQSIASLNPHTKKAGEAGVEAEEFKKMAEDESYKFVMEDERLKGTEESNETFKRRMEQAIQDTQKSQEVAVKV